MRCSVAHAALGELCMKNEVCGFTVMNMDASVWTRWWRIQSVCPKQRREWWRTFAGSSGTDTRRGSTISAIMQRTRRHVRACCAVSMIYVKAQRSFLMTGTEDTLSKQMSFWQDKFVLRCVQFYLNQICDTVVSPLSVISVSTLSVFCSRRRDHRATWSSRWILSFIKLSPPQLELPLELPSNPFRAVR